MKTIFRRSLIAIDLGAARTRIYIDGKLVLEEPSAITVNKKNGKVVYSGQDVFVLRESPSSSYYKTYRVKDNPEDLWVIRMMLQSFMRRVRWRHLIWRPVIAFAIDLDTTEEVKEALRNMAF